MAEAHNFAAQQTSVDLGYDTKNAVKAHMTGDFCW